MSHTHGLVSTKHPQDYVTYSQFSIYQAPTGLCHILTVYYLPSTHRIMSHTHGLLSTKHPPDYVSYSRFTIYQAPTGLCLILTVYYLPSTHRIMSHTERRQKRAPANR